VRLGTGDFGHKDELGAAMTRLLPILLLCLLAAPAVARDPSGAAVSVTTLPAGADTWVDGAYVGRTPVLVDALVSGHHTITTAKTGWESREVDVVVSERLPFQFVDLQLSRAPGAARGTGKLVIHAQVPLEGVLVDGAPVGVSKMAPIDLDPGPHELTFRTARGKTVRRIVIYAETTTNVVFRGRADEGDRAVVVAPAFNYLPASEVAVDGKHLMIRHNGHHVTGLIGDPTMRIDGSETSFDSAPSLVGGKLYLPLDLYLRIGAVPLRAR
jgi:hypothetical protein